ncbi:CoA pyrophosphatase [Vibrio aestuarianus]|nr:CoA pyrophosphatase [Vibrio aestuarianus]KOE77824.1 DNA mismatch repair protein MutT [Vibrio alginolyticus]MDF9399593.1 CoA pyrophosphatase [Vibrio sp. 1180_3]NGZ64807.1 CoA pyrophosphatase [Vibrio aestuarianus subsp. cardii]NGZ14215.1 CoA pyrophosphatase [Vibrio aestuarianus]NGZ17339.1 CoA pyrophosphatase [Vibrio aestuarianus]
MSSTIACKGEIVFKLTKIDFIQSFQLNRPVGYHAESLQRVAHLSSSSLRRASVLVGFVEREAGLYVVLTKRAAHLKHHPGQISFPGGKYEEWDHSLYQTAIREAEEETGIKASQIEILGHLPELVTVSKFSVTPVVAFIQPDYQAKLDDNEVEELFEVPANYLFDRTKLYSGLFQVKNQAHRVFAIPYQQHFIWGMTAQIIQALQTHIISPT